MILGLIVIGTFLLVITMGYLSAYDQLNSKRSSERAAARAKQHHRRGKASEETNYSPAFYQLNSLTHSIELTKRMIEHVAQRNPDRDQAWCIDKAIYDIERDRMA